MDHVFSLLIQADLLAAIITLTSKTQGIIPAKRILKLNPDRLTIPIGRASRSVSKGLLSGEDNAWFDNPVMSRDHAELIFDPDSRASLHNTFSSSILLNYKQSIMIKDIKSMH